MVTPVAREAGDGASETGPSSPGGRGLGIAWRTLRANPGAVYALAANVFTVWLLRGSTMVCRFLLTVFAVRMLSLEEFGTYGLITAAVATGVYVIGLQFYTFNLREIASTQEPLVQTRHIRDQLIFHAGGYATLGLVYGILCFAAGWEISPWLVILLPAEHLSQEGYRLLVAFSRLQAANAIFFIRSGLWVLLWIGYGLWGGVPTLKSLCWFWFGGSFLSLAITAMALKGLPWREAAGVSVDWRWIRRGLKTCALYSAIVLFFAVAQYVGRYVLDHAHGPAAVGVFFFFVSMANPVYTLVEAGPYSALQPQLLRLHPGQPAEYRSKLRMLSLGVVVSGIVATVAVAVVTALYLRWSERVDLLGELPAFGWICAASLVNSLVLIPQAHLFTSRRDNLILAVNFAAMLTAVGTSLWLIPRFGVLGAAWSGGMTSAVLLLATTAAALRWREGRA